MRRRQEKGKTIQDVISCYKNTPTNKIQTFGVRKNLPFNNSQSRKVKYSKYCEKNNTARAICVKAVWNMNYLINIYIINNFLLSI